MEQQIFAFFQDYAYQPWTVYTFIILFMTASSFGLPIPEEIILLSSGLVAYMAQHPELYPPPTPGMEGVNLYVIATVCFVAVLASDLLIYFLGRKFGRKILFSRLFRSEGAKKNLRKIEAIYARYGHLGCGFFRFLPGIRFPGHLSCGMMRIPVSKFLLIDGSAALFSVPSQVFLVAEYGEVIISKVKQFNFIVMLILAAIFVVWISRKYVLYRKNKNTNNVVKESV